MSDSRLIERIRRGPSGVRVILVPKQKMIDQIGISKPARKEKAIAQEVREDALRFDEAVMPSLRKLQLIGLHDVTPQDKRVRTVTDHDLIRENKAKIGMFERLSLVRAVAVRMRQDSKIEDVLDAASDEFDVVLDVRTDSDLTAAKSRIATRLPKRIWPDYACLDEAWNRNIRGTGVVVGVLDTGIDADHAEFKGKQVEFRYFPPSALDGATSRNVRGFDTDGHGTHVCGVIAGRKMGLARDVNLHVASVIESDTLRASLWRTVYGLDWMFRLFIEQQFVNVPSIVNLSLCFSRT